MVCMENQMQLEGFHATNAPSAVCTCSSRLRRAWSKPWRHCWWPSHPCFIRLGLYLFPLTHPLLSVSISSTLMEMESTVSSGRSTPAMMNGQSSASSSGVKTVAYPCCWDLCPQYFSCSPDLAEHIRGIHVDGQRGGVSRKKVNFFVKYRFDLLYSSRQVAKQGNVLFCASLALPVHTPKTELSSLLHLDLQVHSSVKGLVQKSL